MKVGVLFGTPHHWIFKFNRAMIDYIRASMPIDCKDTKIFLNLQNPDVFSSGWLRYYLDGCKKMEVWINPANGLLEIKGSVSYFIQGHNFSFSKHQFFEAIKHIGNLLHLPLWEALIEEFEFGVICDVAYKPSDYIAHHYSPTSEHLTKEEKAKDNGNFAWWAGKAEKLKMYDAGKNIMMKQGLHRQDIIADCGWNPAGQYLKWEVHYIKPELLNNGRAIRIKNLCNADWYATFKEDCYIQYKRLIPMKSIIMPTNKKDLTTPDIMALAFLEDGMHREELKKLLYAKVNSISDDILSKSDKDARKRQIKKLIDKLEDEPQSKWDLSAEISKALSADV